MRFDDSCWHYEKIYDSFELLKGNGYSKSDLSNEGKPIILYGHLYTTYLTEIINEVQYYTNQMPSNTVLSKRNDVIIPASGETPEDIATAFCVTMDDVILGGDLNILRSKTHNGIFVSYQLNKKRKYDIAKLAVGKSIVHLHNSDLQNISLSYPNSIEIENKISTFIGFIDDRILTQKKIICNLESLIKYTRNKLLFEMDKNSEHISLNECLIEFNEKSIKNDEYPVLSSTKEGIFLQSEYFNKETSNEDTTGYKIVPENYCTYRSMSDTGSFTFNKQNIVEKGIISPAYPVFTTNEKMNADFIIEYMNNSRFFKSSLLETKEGGTRFALSYSKLLKLAIADINIEQQLKYISTVKSIIEKIKNEKKILSLYEQQKQYLLNHMFI